MSNPITQPALWLRQLADAIDTSRAVLTDFDYDVRMDTIDVSSLGSYNQHIAGRAQCMLNLRICTQPELLREVFEASGGSATNFPTQAAVHLGPQPRHIQLP